jgi:predicted methyltransferase
MEKLSTSFRRAGAGSSLLSTLRAATALPLLCAALVIGSGCATTQSPEAAAPAAVPTEPATPEGAPAEEAAEVAPSAIVEAPDRTPEDRQADERRQPARLLEFLGVGRGERVADLGAGAGYTTELLARAVGPSGTVYAQNNKLTLEKYVSESWPERLERDATRNVVRMDREFESPFTPEAQDLDLVTLLFSYHDVIAQNGDRSKLNAAVFQALKPGGKYVVADHQAPPGTGVEAATTLHRIDENIVRQEIAAAGFKFVEAAEFLQDPADDGKEPSFKVGFKTSRFILKFEKPRA